jgi:hypothetical protein
MVYEGPRVSRTGLKPLLAAYTHWALGTFIRGFSRTDAVELSRWGWPPHIPVWSNIARKPQDRRRRLYISISPSYATASRPNRRGPHKVCCRSARHGSRRQFPRASLARPRGLRPWPSVAVADSAVWVWVKSITAVPPSHSLRRTMAIRFLISTSCESGFRCPPHPTPVQLA